MSDSSDRAGHMTAPDPCYQELDCQEDTRHPAFGDAPLPPVTLAEYDRLLLMIQTIQADQLQLRNNFFRATQDLDRLHASFKRLVQRLTQLELVAAFRQA